MLPRPSPRIPTTATRWLFRRHSSHATLTDLATAKRLEAEYASSVVHGRSVNPAFYHPRTHNIPVAIVHFRSFTPQLLDLFTHFATHAASSLAIPVSRPVYLPTQRSLWTVPKGPFAHKKSQENFERKVHKRAIKAWDADDEVVGFWLKYLRRHMLAGVGIRSTTWQRVPVGFGQKTLKETMDRLQMSTPVTDAERVKALGDKIVCTELAAADTVVPHPS